MNINYDILEKLREYYSGSMPPNGIKEVEQLILKDAEYSRHDQLFRATEKGIKDSQRAWIQEVDETDITTDQWEQLKSIKKNDQRNRRNRWGFLGLLLLIVALPIIYFTWPTDDKLEEQRSPPSTNKPIAGGTEDTDEDLLGSPGNALRGAITIWTYTNENLSPQESEGKVNISIQQTKGTEPYYYFQNDSLFVLINEITELNLNTIYWLRNEGRSTLEDYLQIEGVLYAIDPTKQQEQPLQAPTSNQVPEMIQ